MSKNILGIDISKNEISVALLIHNRKNYCHSVFENNLDGFTKLEQWVKTLTDEKISICFEATGTYGDSLAEYFYSKGYMVGVINPLQIKSFSQTKLSRHKTDKIDASIIAEYGFKFDFRAYKPISKTRKELRSLYRCSLSIQEQITHCINQLEHRDHLSAKVVSIWESHINSFQSTLDEIEKKILEIITSEADLLLAYQNLQSISGIGKKSAIAILAEIANIEDFKNARQLAAFLGLTPKHKVSGSSVYSRPRISKMGSSILRKALFFSAMSAARFNPYLKEFAQVLSLKGKAKKSIICAVMRKLVHIIFGVLKSKKSFDITILKKNNSFLEKCT